MSKRTTVTFEDDVESSVRAEVRRTGQPFRQVVNELVREALDARQARKRNRGKVTWPTAHMGPKVDITSAWAVLEEAEGPGWK